jgi:hypothetical protein
MISPLRIADCGFFQFRISHLGLRIWDRVSPVLARKRCFGTRIALIMRSVAGANLTKNTRRRASEIRNPKSKGSILRLALTGVLGAYLLFAHGCHGAADTELRTIFTAESSSAAAEH